MSDQIPGTLGNTADSGLGAPAPIPSSTTGADAQGIPQAAEPTYDVTINGKVEKVALSELQKGYSRTQDYTQKTQRLAAERQQILAQVGEYEAALKEVQSFLSDRNRVYQYARSMGATPQQATQMADGAAEQAGTEELLTRGQAQAMVAELLQQQLPQVQGQSQQQIQQLRLELATREYQNIFDQKISQLQEAHPELKQLGQRGAQLLRMEALNQRPQSVESALEALELAASSLVGDFGNVLKQQVTSQGSNPLHRGIEPPGGQGILPAPSPNFKNVRDPGLRAAAIQDLLNASRSNG